MITKVYVNGEVGYFASEEESPSPPQEQTHIYGAEWDGSATTAWSRTDDAADFTDPIPAVDNGNGSSPFDNLMPWAGMTISERVGGTMVAIPKFWYTLTQNGDGLKIQIADHETEGFHVSPAHMDRGDGHGERDVVYIGRYHCIASSDLKSTPGNIPKRNLTRSDFRSRIHALGDDIWQNDFAMRFTIWLLYLVEFADWNSQKSIGLGCGNNTSVGTMGYTDSMPYHTGTTQNDRNTYALGTQYRNIEGLWDNCYDFVDGCYYKSNGLNIILNPNMFNDGSNGINVGIPKDGWPSAFNVVNQAGFPMIIPSASGGAGNIASCDCWDFNASNPAIIVGGDYSQVSYNGLFYVGYVTAKDTYISIGSRLMELPND